MVSYFIGNKIMAMIFFYYKEEITFKFRSKHDVGFIYPPFGREMN